MKVMVIDALLRWAYRDELPKAVDRGTGGRWAPGFMALASYGQLYTLVDEPNRYGVMPSPAGGEPHADAMAVWRAVQALDAAAFDLGPDWAPLDDLGALGVAGADAVARAVQALSVQIEGGRLAMRTTARDLVERHARLGDQPAWQIDPPVVRPVVSRNGRLKWFVREEMVLADGTVRVVEVDGFDRTAGRPVAGAYTKTELEPDPVLGLVARGEWAVWRAALDVLADVLSGTLLEHIVGACRLPYEPWAATERRPVVHRAIRA